MIDDNSSKWSVRKKITVTLLIISLGIGITTVGLLVSSTYDLYHKSSISIVVKNPIKTNATYVNFMFYLQDKHIPSNYQTHMSNNYYDQRSMIVSPDGHEMIGRMIFADNSTGKLLPFKDQGTSVVKFTNSSDIWMSDELSDNYIVNVTETVDQNYNHFIEKGINVKNNDGTVSHWFKLKSKDVFNYLKNEDDRYVTPIVVLYIFYNNPGLDNHVKECTDLYNQVINHEINWNYAHAKFTVECSQNDVFRGNWQ